MPYTKTLTYKFPLLFTHAIPLSSMFLYAISKFLSFIWRYLQDVMTFSCWYFWYFSRTLWHSVTPLNTSYNRNYFWMLCNIFTGVDANWTICISLFSSLEAWQVEMEIHNEAVCFLDPKKSRFDGSNQRTSNVWRTFRSKIHPLDFDLQDCYCRFLCLQSQIQWRRFQQKTPLLKQK